MSRTAFVAAPAASAAPLLQRRCAQCGGDKDEQKPCKSCSSGVMAKLEIGAADDRYEREADRVASAVMRGDASSVASGPVAVQRASTASGGGEAAPAIVGDALRGQAERLDAGSQRFFEQRFGHDFSRVAIHRDSLAADSAQAVRAKAYTVGEHLVFNRGRYQPDSAAGRELIAHELTHVLQQRGSLQRASLTDEPEYQSGAVRLQREPMDFSDFEDEDPMGLDTGLPRERERRPTRGGTVSYRESQRLASDARLRERMETEAAAAEAACRAAAPADPLECDPARALEWSDFTATAPTGGRFGAETGFTLVERAINIADRSCSRTSTRSAPARGVQARFDPGRSWVKARYAQASDVAQNGCARFVTNCEAAFDSLQPNQHFTTFPAMQPPNPVTCAASATVAGTPATTRDECATVMGADCTSTAVAESARLLNHERYHFKLGCAVARKANTMLATTADFDALLAAAQRVANTQTTAYDNETDHGCNAGPQSNWETAIDADLPAVTITVPAARARGRRRR